ncbi:glycosyltransferase family 61 protein, partial [Synechocystis sp. LEGE 06083]
FFEECCRKNFLTEALVGNKVYISRSQFPKGMVAGEAALEKELKNNGYYIVYPEKMPFYDQLKVMRGADVVVGVSGSALHNIIFLDEPPKKIIEIQRRGRSNGTQKIINKAKGVVSQSIYAILDSSSTKSSASVKMDAKELSEKLKTFTEGSRVYLPAQEYIDREYEALISYESIRDVINKTPDHMVKEVFDFDDIDAIKNLCDFRSFSALNFYMGRLYACFEEYEKANENFRAAIVSSPRNAVYKFYYAKFCAKNSDYISALEWVSRALDLDAENDNYKKIKLECLEKIGAYREALDFATSFNQSSSLLSYVEKTVERIEGKLKAI